MNTPFGHACRPDGAGFSPERGGADWLNRELIKAQASLRICHVLGGTMPVVTAILIAQPADEAGLAEDLSRWVAGWNSFYSEIIAPAVALLIPIAIVWLLILLVTRLLALTAVFGGTTVRRRTSLWTRVIGFILTGGAAVAFVVGASSGEAGLSGREAILPILLALFGMSIYAFGMATRPRLAATVTDSKGAVNAALTTELLARMRELNADDTRGRVGEPSTSDLNEIIAVAGQSENWLVNVVAGAMSALFNVTPWRLDVTILDKKNALAVLHRNGRQVEDATLTLPADPDDTDHPGELLAVAAAFGAVTVARCYPDIVGFYGAQDWRGIGWLAATRGLPKEKRRVYLERALEADPQSILVEHAELFRRYAANPTYDVDREQLESLMDALEPMIREAAILSHVHRDELEAIEPKPWHSTVDGPREPRLLMLRLMTLYTTFVRNWTALSERTDTASAGARRQRAAQIIDVFIDELPKTPPRDRRAARRDLMRMEQRASLSYALLREPGSSADPANRPGRLEDARARRSEWIQHRVIAARDSNDFDVRYSYACYLARRRHAGDMCSDTEPEAIAKRLALVLDVIDDYRDGAIDDPELRLLAAATPMRNVVLARDISAWDIKRFARHRTELEARGIIDPVRLSAPYISAKRLKSDTFDLATAQSLIDGARILAAAPRISPAGIDDPARLRAVQVVLDEGHSVDSLLASWADPRARKAMTATVGKALFWNPDAGEQVVVEKFLGALVASLRKQSLTRETQRPLAVRILQLSHDGSVRRRKKNRARGEKRTRSG